MISELNDRTNKIKIEVNENQKNPETIFLYFFERKLQKNLKVLFF